MSGRRTIPFERFRSEIFRDWRDRWLLLTAGDGATFNPMTVAWGACGVMWGKPFVTVVVRPTRHTFLFMERYPDFTLCAFPDAMKDRLLYCGTHSGRDVDKVAACGLTPVALPPCGAPGYAEASLVLACRKVYTDDLDPKRFLDPSIAHHYDGDYHRIYFGEVLAVEGTSEYLAPAAPA